MSEPSSRSGRPAEREEELIRLAQERTTKGLGTPRSQSAFTELYLHYLEDISTFLLCLMKNRAEAEEVVAQTFLIAWTSLPGWIPKPTSEAPFRGWLFKIAHNEARQSWRKTARWPRLMDQNSSPEPPQIPSWLFGAKIETEATVDEQACIQQALETLSDEERNVLLLYSEGGCRVKEIVQILEIKALTEGQAERKVRRILARAEKKFVRAYDEECRP